MLPPTFNPALGRILNSIALRIIAARQVDIDAAASLYVECPVLEHHEAHQCPNRRVPCPCLAVLPSLDFVAAPYPESCGMDSDLRAKDIEQHLQECPYREATCTLGCGRVLLAKDEESHMCRECPYRNVRCPNGCGIHTLQARLREAL